MSGDDTGREYPSRPWVGIGCVLFKGDAVLLCRRGKPPRVGSWSLPGGAQDLGEAAIDCARRELREETGVEAGALTLADVIDGIALDMKGAVRYHYTIIDYAGHWLSGEARPGDDVAEVAWALPHELASYRLTPQVTAIIAKARAILA
ncbi:NUDIX domain-containing protein [Rhodovarius crocodyli]|uniref:NUDIX domain-containing protein n=1 Tax=Rhodovarius crocodyli TaxID=1979269 RepID=A0A437LW25_9PROT|nr:NUDIX hydrolase [Rhodovarius crocodyli]RVT89595.1 NUDIX domain-containing protein [Rhodovarius crocodyli]